MRQSANPRSDRPAEAAAQALHLAFAPLDKSAFGAAVGAVAAIFFGSITLVSVQIPPAERPPLEALVVFFPGYEVSGGGAILGGVWVGFAGFVAGWFLAFCRNMALAGSLFLIRTRAELARTRDFLDHL